MSAEKGAPRGAAKPGRKRRLWRWLSTAWSWVNAGMRLLVRWGWIEEQELGIPVVSIGNLEAGGTGKTPLVADLARFAHARGKRVAILTRGYGGAVSRAGGCMVLAPAGAGMPAPVVDPREVGDEAALLRELAPQAWIAVGAERQRALQGLTDPVDLVILDDGLQQFKIRRDVDIVAVTSHAMDEALFRENPTHFVVESRAREARGQPVFWVWTKGERWPLGWNSIPEHRRVRLPWKTDWLAGSAPGDRTAKLWLVTSVAHPAEVRRSLEAAGFTIARHTALRDHAPISARRIARLRKDAQVAGMLLLVTGKDWVKWKPHGGEPPAVVERRPGPEAEALWEALGAHLFREAATAARVGGEAPAPEKPARVFGDQPVE